MKVWWLAGGAAVLAAAVVGAFVLHSGGKPAVVKASVVKVARGSVTTTVSASGTVQAQQSRSLGFATSGTITELNVKPGDLVNPGAVLARIDATAAQDSVNAASDSVSSAQDALTKAQTAEDAAVTAAATPTVVATPRATPSATTTRGGTQGGAQGGAQGATQNAAAQASQAAQIAANNLNSASDNLFNAQQRLNNANLSLKQANMKLSGTVILAPVGGKVLSVSGAIGSQGGSNVITLAGTGDVVIRAQFTEAEVAHLAVAQVAKITLPDKAATTFTGKVIQIDPAGTLSTRLVRYAALISFDKVPNTLLYGQSATVAVTTASVDNVLSVPSTAVQDGYVVVKVNGTNQKRAVETGLRGDVNTEVKSGLAEGDEVLTAGQ